MTLLSKATLKRHFNRAAKSYAQSAVLQREVLQRLIARFDFMKMNPSSILDCGARCGMSTQVLRERFPKAKVVAYDYGEGFLNQFQKSWYQRHSPRVCGDYTNLAFRDRQFDVVFSNLTLHWANDLKQILQEFYRILKPHGLLLFSTVGPDTLKELRASFADESSAIHIHSFVDMHDIGDLLIKTHFLDPVMDMEYLQIRYDSVSHLVNDLKATGATNARLDRRNGLMGKTKWQAVHDTYQARWSLIDGVIPATVEIIYGHAWLPETPDLAKVNAQGEVHVPVSVLRRQLS